MAARDILDVLLRFRADTRQAKQSIEETTESVDKLSNSFKTLGAGLAGALTGAAAKGALDFMSELASAADRIGLTTDALQELRFVGQQAGIQVDELDDVMQSFVERLGDAQGQTGEAYEALQALGVNLESTRGGFKSTEQVLYEVSDAFANLDDAQQRVFRSQQLFESDVGVKFLNVLTQGSEAMREMRQRARELGIVMDEDMIRKSQEANRQLGTLAFILRGQFNRGVAEAAPLITKLGEGFEFLLTNIGRTYGMVRQFVAGNEEATKSLDEIAEATHTVSSAITEMNADVQSSMEQTRQALSGDAPKEVETLADAAAIRLEAARAINARDFQTAAQRLKEYNDALLTLRDSGKESTGILRGMFLQGESLARTLETVSRTPAPPPMAAVTPLGQPETPLIPVTPPSRAPGEGTFGPGVGHRGRVVTRPGPGGVGTVQEFVEEPPPEPIDERTVAERLQRQQFMEEAEQARLRQERRSQMLGLGGQVSTLLQGTGLNQVGPAWQQGIANIADAIAPAVERGMAAGWGAISGLFKNETVWSPRSSDVLTDALAQAERQHGPVN